MSRVPVRRPHETNRDFRTRTQDHNGAEKTPTQNRTVQEPSHDAPIDTRDKIFAFTIVIPGAGHVPPLERPAATTQALLEFLHAIP